jgi:hypothetical protein
MLYHNIIMEGPSNEEAEAEAFTPMESVINSGRTMLSGTPTPTRRKNGKRTETTRRKMKMQTSQQRKKPRLDPIIKRTAVVTSYNVTEIFSDSDDDEEPKAIVDTYTSSSLLGKKRLRILDTSTTEAAKSTAEAAKTTASPDVAKALPPPVDDDADDADDVADDDDVANTDSVADTQSNPRATGATGIWTRVEDAELTSSVANTRKKKYGLKYVKDWAAIAALVPSRTSRQCQNRWHDFLYPSTALADRREGPWTEDEDSKLKNSLQMHSGCSRKDWVAISALVPGRTISQCRNRSQTSKLSRAVFTYSSHAAEETHIPIAATTASARVGLWTEDEDNKLKGSIQKHGGKDWAAIAALVPGRTRTSCHRRWHDFLHPSIALAAGREGPWTEDEDSKLKDAVQLYGGRDWAAIAALVPGRKRISCQHRWHAFLHPTIALAAGREGLWAEDEDSKLKDAVQLHGGRDWAAIAALVPGRTKRQCSCRWQSALNPSNVQTAGRTRAWTEDEDSKLKNSLQMHSGCYRKDWVAISALVPGRTIRQCQNRSHTSKLSRAVFLYSSHAAEDTHFPISLDLRSKKKPSLLPPQPSLDLRSTHLRERQTTIGLVPNPSATPIWENQKGRKWTEDDVIKLKHAVHSLGSRRSTGSARQSRISVVAPRGKLGIILVNKAGFQGTVVAGVRSSSVLADTIFSGDRILAIDGENVSLMTVSEIATIMARKSEFERTLSVLPTPAHYTSGKERKNWIAIAMLVPGRTPDQCRCRWKTTYG